MDREVVPRITTQWVDENVMPWLWPRDRKVIEYVARAGVTTSSLIQKLLFPRAGVNKCNRRLRKLYEHHVLDRQRPRAPIGAGSLPAVYYLDRAGALLLGQREFRRRERLPQTWKHTVAINTVHAELCRLPGWDLRHWSTEEANRIEFVLDRRYALVPDALGILKGPQGQGLALYVECDRATEQYETLLAKLQTYERLYMSRAWLTQPWARSQATPTFPKVFFVFGGRNAEKRMAALRKASTLHLFEFGLLTDLETQLRRNTRC